MKYYATIPSFLLLATILISISSCGSDDPSTPAEEKQLAKISGTWQLESAMLGITPWDDKFENATLTLSGEYEKGGTYDFAFTVPDAPLNSPWPDNGNWKFKGTSGADLNTKIVRLDDGVEMTYSLSADELTLTFPYSGDGFPDARISSVSGDWTFVFTK